MPWSEDGGMKVRFVGSGDAFGSGGRWQTCIHVSGEGQALLVDCGATSLTALKAQGLDPNEVGAVAVTHLHGDHFGGLPFWPVVHASGTPALGLRVSDGARSFAYSGDTEWTPSLVDAARPTASSSSADRG